MENHSLNDLIFIVLGSYNDIEFTDEQRYILNQPSNLENVLLCSNWDKQTYRTLDFRRTTNEEAIKKILIFYKHKTFRRLIGNHIFFEGFIPFSNDTVIVYLGS